MKVNEEINDMECRKDRERCPFCGAEEFKEVQEHGHYRTECCKQITQGCCNGEQG